MLPLGIGGQSMKAVIMAGGLGTRLHPLTVNLPKPLVPVVNRPLLEHLILHLKSQGITQFILPLFRVDALKRLPFSPTLWW